VDLRALRVVVAIADEGSVTRAGRALHQSPSAVSHTLKDLERELDVELFHRLPRGMSPTDAGDAFIVGARRTLFEADRLRAEVDDVKGIVTGQLSVIALRSFTVPLAELLAPYSRTYPGVVVRVLAPETQTGVAEVVRTGGCEVGFMRNWEMPADLDHVTVASERTVVVVPAGHPLADRGTITIAELDGERMVAPPRSSAMRPSFDDAFQRNRLEPNVVAEAAANEMVLELVRVGVGCTIAASSSVASVADRGVYILDLAGYIESDIVLVTRAGQPLTPAAKAFRDLVAGADRASLSVSAT
jgi:DNA-binding transcriptional LysR family regulator